MKNFIEPKRNISVKEKAEIIVCGGGPSGISAAISAARNNKEVLLIEKNGFLGGMATSGLVNPFMPSYAGDKPIIKGIFGEIVERLLELDAAINPKIVKQGTGYSGFAKWPHAHTTPFDPEILKWVILDMIEESGVKLLLHSFIVDTIVENNEIKGLILESKSGRFAVEGNFFIDATGDGDILERSGISYNKGRKEDNKMQPATIFFRLGNVNREKIDKYIETYPEEHHFKSFVKTAKNKGEFFDSKHDVLFFYSPRENEVFVNTTRIHDIDGTNVFDLTKAEIETRKQVRILVNFFKKYVPGFENSVLLNTASQVGIRETRRLSGEYILTKEDVLNVNQFEDNIAQCAYMIDVHSPTGTKLLYDPIPEGKSYGIPFRSLLPKNCNNLLVAGRCISADHEALASARVMPPSMATGQAAGTASALAIEQGVNVHNININKLRELLKRNNQIVDPL